MFAPQSTTIGGSVTIHTLICGPIDTPARAEPAIRKRLTDITIRTILIRTMASPTGLSTLSLAILSLIAHEPSSTYRLRKAFMATPMGHFSTSPGAIYPAVRRIEQSGWIKGRIVDRETLRPKRVYRITESGRRRLIRRLTRPVRREDVLWHMDDLMLRFAFMDRFVGRDEILVFLRQFESQLEAHVSHLERFLKAPAARASMCGRLSMEHGFESYKTSLAWVRRAIEEVVRAAS